MAGEGRGIQQAYKDRLAELKVPHDSDGKIEVNGKFIYIQKPEDRDALIASGMDAELAEQVYQANFGNGVTGGLKMQEVHQANLQRDVAIAGNFKFEDKEYSVVQVIMAGQDVNDINQYRRPNIQEGMVKAWQCGQPILVWNKRVCRY